ncbi:MAG: hypothetical protein AB7V40_00710 [Methyloceanibacter sp.]
MSRAVLALAIALAIVAMPRFALACACCTHEGQRNVAVMAFESNRREVIADLRFAGEAKLYLGEADPDSVKGIASPSVVYSMKAEMEGTRLLFTLASEGGESGSLALQLPEKISIFEVDPRNAPDEGTGPGLYKEWKLTGPVSGSGAFAAGAGPGQLLTLIVQGSGNACTSGSDFSHWTLVMQGPKANYTLFGALAR